MRELEDRTLATLSFGARSRALVESGRKPPHRAVNLIHGDLAQTVMANIARATAAGLLVPIEVSCVKR